MSEGISDAVAEVQGGRMPGPLSKISVSRSRELSLARGERLDSYPSLCNKLIEAAARNRVARGIDNDRRFKITACGHLHMVCPENEADESFGLRFIPQYGNHC